MISLQAEFRAAAISRDHTMDEAMLEAKRLYVEGSKVAKRRIRTTPKRPNGWRPMVGDTAMVVRPRDAEYPERFHGLTVEIRSVLEETFMCRVKHGSSWSRLTAIPVADLYPSDKPPIDPSPVQAREDAWAGRRVSIVDTDHPQYGRRGTVVRGIRGKCVVRIDRGGEYEVLKEGLKIVG